MLQVRVSGSQYLSRMPPKTGSRNAVTDAIASSGVGSERSSSARHRAYGFRQPTGGAGTMGGHGCVARRSNVATQASMRASERNEKV